IDRELHLAPGRPRGRRTSARPSMRTPRRAGSRVTRKKLADGVCDQGIAGSVAGAFRMGTLRSASPDFQRAQLRALKSASGTTAMRASGHHCWTKTTNDLNHLDIPGVTEQLQRYSELCRLLPCEDDIVPENLGAIVQAIMVIDELVKTRVG